MAIAAADNAVADNVIASCFFMVLLADGQMTVTPMPAFPQMNVLRETQGIAGPRSPYTVQLWLTFR